MTSAAKQLSYVSASSALIAAPILVQAKTFAEIVNGDIVPLGNTIISLLYALCFVMFLIGMARHFFSPNEEARQKGRMFAVWGVIALVVLFGVWGLVKAMLGVLNSFNT